jgi:uncharacterized protein (TIGR00251 family)
MVDLAAETIDLRVIPRARRNEVGGERAGRLVVRTTATPVDGAANQAVCRILADHFGVRPGDVEIVAGHHRRDKTVRVNRLGNVARPHRYEPIDHTDM